MAKIIVTKRTYQKKYPYVQTERVIIDSGLEFSQGAGCTTVKQSNGRKLEIEETLEEVASLINEAEFKEKEKVWNRILENQEETLKNQRKILEFIEACCADDE